LTSFIALREMRGSPSGDGDRWGDGDGDGETGAVTNIFLDRFIIIPVECLWSVSRPGLTGAFSFPTQLFETAMSSLRPQDRKSLCRFTFADGRQCRTPRSPGHPHLCSDHARKDSQAHALECRSLLSLFFFGGIHSRQTTRGTYHPLPVRHSHLARWPTRPAFRINTCQKQFQAALFAQFSAK
jgi:hypothetical protein